MYRDEFINHWQEANAELTRLHRQEDDLMKLRTRWVDHAARLRATVLLLEHMKTLFMISTRSSISPVRRITYE